MTRRRNAGGIHRTRGGRAGLPAGTRPRSSSEISSNGVKASCSSATSTRSGPKPAIANTASAAARVARKLVSRSEEHTSELQSQSNLVCRLLLEKKKKISEHEPLAASYRQSDP